MIIEELTPDLMGKPEEFIRQELDMLEFLFDDPGLTKLRRKVTAHPAVSRFDAIKSFLVEPNLQYPNENDLALEIGSLLLDRMNLERTPLLAQVWNNLGDVEVQ